MPTQPGQSNIAGIDHRDLPPAVQRPDLVARRRSYQCPGCFSRCELLPPGRERSYECDCGEALTCTDLRGDDE